MPTAPNPQPPAEQTGVQAAPVQISSVRQWVGLGALVALLGIVVTVVGWGEIADGQMAARMGRVGEAQAACVTRVDGVEARLTAQETKHNRLTGNLQRQFAAVKAEVKADIAASEGRLRQDLSEMRREQSRMLRSLMRRGAEE